jgi:hypothetical protein
MEKQKKAVGETTKQKIIKFERVAKNALVQPLEKYSNEMVRDAFLNHRIKEDFTAVVLEYNGTKTLALVFDKMKVTEEN